MINFFSRTTTLFICATLLIVSCSSTEQATVEEATVTPVTNFDADSYINPNDYGYDLMGSSDDVPGIADTSFVPVEYDAYTAQKRMEYPKFARRNGIQGKVVLEVYIDSTGTLTNIKVIKSPHSLLTEASKNAALQTDYTPATLNGKPVNSFLRIPSLFQLWSSGD